MHERKLDDDICFAATSAVQASSDGVFGIDTEWKVDNDLSTHEIFVYITNELPKLVIRCRSTG